RECSHHAEGVNRVPGRRTPSRLPPRSRCDKTSASSGWRLAPGEEMTMRFRDQVAVITAAASGIGKATAEIIGSEGGIVVAVDTDQGRLDKAMAGIRDAGGRAHGRRADALDAANVQDVADGVIREHGR